MMGAGHMFFFVKRCVCVWGRGGGVREKEKDANDGESERQVTAAVSSKCEDL